MIGVLFERLCRGAQPTAIALLLLLAGCVQVDTDGDEVENGSDTVEVEGRAAAGDTLDSVDPIVRGRASYMTYCASCHGSDGEGDGPVAEVMTTQPADLTQLRDEDGGYPVDSVYAYIDGRADVQAHGTREMPVWGNVWGEVAGRPVPQEEVDQRIRELVEYIRTIQVAPDSVDASV